MALVTFTFDDPPQPIATSVRATFAIGRQFGTFNLSATSDLLPWQRAVDYGHEVGCLAKVLCEGEELLPQQAQELISQTRDRLQVGLGLVAGRTLAYDHNKWNLHLRHWARNQFSAQRGGWPDTCRCHKGEWPPDGLFNSWMVGEWCPLESCLHHLEDATCTWMVLRISTEWLVEGGIVELAKCLRLLHSSQTPVVTFQEGARRVRA